MQTKLVIVTPTGVSPTVRTANVASALAQLPRGMAAVILRDPGLTAAAALAHRLPLKDACRAAGAPLFVHRDLEPTTEDNWHLPDRPDSLSAAGGARGLLSLSTHSAAAALAAAELVDIVLVGPIWPTSDKPNALGLDALARAKAGMHGTRARLFAIGGITSQARASQALEAGADGLAGIRSFAGTQISEIAHAFQT